MLNQHRDPEEEIRALIHGPVRIQTLDRVIFELGRLARTRSSKLGAMAEASLELFEQRNYLVLENKLGSPEVDTTLIAFALTEKKPIVVATVDKQLRETLNTQGIATIYPKTRSGLVQLRVRN